jgi:outer membrane protein OmpA-like peptidoglycan-associated protein
MMSLRNLLKASLALVLLLPRGAAAEGVEVNVVRAALEGHGWPQITAELTEPVTGLRLDLKRSDGGEVHLSSGKLGRGAKKVFDLKQPNGAFVYTGNLVAQFPHAPPKTLPISFEGVVLPPPKLKVGDQAVNTKEHTVTLSADRAIAELELKVHSDEGQLIDTLVVDMSQVKPGEPMVATWRQTTEATVLRIEVRASDQYGFYQDVELFPWKVEIPHEDVLFDSGKAEILPGEAPKLEAALAELRKAIEKYGKYARVQLFVAGYTDTVGDGASNKALSQARALSIGRYFRSHGVRIPLSVTGFGEDGLLVPTPDETAEARNRRAAYVVAIEPPRGANWTPIP